MGILLNPLSLILIAVVAFLLFFAMGRISNSR
jgi:Sec-independent protein translocase protein TatA